jgi:general secretion pathway protein B
MSYILEALKKAEQKRELEERPKSVTFSTETPRPARKQAVWPYLLVAVLIVNIIFLVRWLWVGSPAEPKGAGKTAQDLIVQPPRTQPSPARRRESEAPEVRRPLQQVDQREPKRAVERAPSRPAAPARDASESPALPAKSTPEETAAREPAPHSERRISPATGKLYGLNELPTDVRSGLPEFRITGHAYSAEAQTRVVRINEKILQEGQELSTGLKLDEITPDGVVLSYQGYRFRVGINHSR